MLAQREAQRADALLVLSDEELWNFDSSSAGALQFAAVDVDFFGLRIQVPERVDCDDRQTLPVLLLSKSPAQREWEVLARRNTILVGVERHSGEVRANWAFPTHKRMNMETLPRSASGEPPTRPQAIHTKAQVVDAREVLHLDWQESEYTLRVIRYDWVSNARRTKLVSDKSPERLPYPKEKAAELVRTLAPTLALYRKSEASPALEGQGLAVTLREEDPALLLRASMRVPVPAGALVKGTGPGVPAAVLSATLLFVLRDEHSPIARHLEIPVFSQKPFAPGEVVEAHFTVDLRSLELSSLLLDETLRVYVVCGDELSGPHALK